MRYFLRGYFYGDGCLSGAKGATVALLMGTNNFINNLELYLINNKLISHCGNYGLKERPNYRVMHIKNKEAAKFTEYLFHDDKMVLLPRKHRIIEPVIKGSRWSPEEYEWLTTLALEEVSQKTGRPLSAVKAMRDNVRWPSNPKK